MDTREIIDKIFKDPKIIYELSEFDTFRKPTHELIDMYPKIIDSGREAPQTFQFEIRNLYDSALSMEKESKDLLEKAKQQVEQLIEQAAEKT